MARLLLLSPVKEADNISVKDGVEWIDQEDAHATKNSKALNAIFNDVDPNQPILPRKHETF